MYSGLEDSDVEEQPLEDPSQSESGPADGNRHTPVHEDGHEDGHEYDDVGSVGDDMYHYDQHNEEEVLSPTDGYFGRSGSGPSAGLATNPAYPSDAYSPSSLDREAQVHAASNDPSASGYALAASSQVPHVPDVWVSDPSIEQGSTAESKAREAQEERELSSRRRGGQLDNPLSQNPTSQVRGGGGGGGGSGGGTSASSGYPNSQSSSSTSGSGHPRYGFGPGLSSAAQQSPYSQRYTPSSATAAPAPLSRPQRSGTIYSERSSLFSEAPPAYTPSPTSPSGVSPSSNYQTFSPSNMGRISESESRGLLAGHNQQYRSPQDMGGRQADEDGYGFTRAGHWRDRARGCVPHFTGRTCKLLVFGLVLLFVTLGFVVSFFGSVKDERKNHIPGGSKPGHGGSGSSPIGTMPVQDENGIRLAYPPFDGDMQWAEGQLCTEYQIQYPTQTFNIEFSDTDSLYFFQSIKKDHAYDGQDVHVSGDVVVRRAGKGTPGPSITLEVVSNSEQIELDINWDHNQQQLKILTPPSIPWGRNSRTSPCLQIRATIWTPAGSALDTLSIEAVHLGVKLLDNLSLKTGNLARISSTVGTVVAATDGEKDAKRLMRDGAPASFRLDSRHVEVKTVSSSIAGTWPLYDYLGLQTMSGAIRAGVQPKEALKEKPLPAVLYVHTTSGTVEIYEPVVDAAAAAAAALAVLRTEGGAGAGAQEFGTAVRDIIPPRQYEVEIQTMSGSIGGSVAFGSACHIHTTSGNIDLNLLPVLDRSQITSSPRRGGSSSSSSRSVLETATTSGTTVINVMGALWKNVQTGSYVAPTLQLPTPPRQQGQGQGRGAETTFASPAIRVLDSRHATTSASIHVTYPSTWEGDIDADSMTGRLDVSGRGVDIIRREEEFPGYKKHVLARKGREGVGGSLVCHTMSGSITVAVGS
ncbi:hypothetical protein VM1G_09496 [Cytospora mali]|uniref:Adhesin domain-containing protein n=1 Tax=Cytospora mali TaxID=578113 RepID=A0A194WCD6_CYTMA|nr:hypothetical protein VM1G_09496 [Valsa mali]